ncbi:MAG: glycosyltransferase involved in cell wall biosynthesis [Patiriisocius sp.]
MKLSIITINFNNAVGLKKTIESVVNQTSNDFEYIVIDGGSKDGSIDIIKKYDSKINYWISEPDNGIYHAMNKGILLAKGDYLEFLNSGDILVNETVIQKIIPELNVGVEILYGNMLKQMPNKIRRDKGFRGRQPTLLDFYKGTLNHSPAFIKRSLFDKFGLYDQSLKIASDWKWYLEVIILGRIIPSYLNLDITVFDMNGISSTDHNLNKSERKSVLQLFLPEYVLEDYNLYSKDIFKMKRMNRYPIARKLLWFIERVCFKMDKYFKK